MLSLFDGVLPIYTTIEEHLEVIDSCRSTSTERLKAISQLEEEFGKVVFSGNDEPGSSTRFATNAWWEAQKRPRSCVALSLVCLVHRLHLQCQLTSKAKSTDESELNCSQFISCFTILQGLCLKDEESRRICGKKSTLELVIDLIGADYWTMDMLLSNAPAHAIDLLICTIITSSSALQLVESLQGEDVVRKVMEKHTIGKDRIRGSARRAVTLDEVQENPLANKCAEFLLFFEYGSEEFKAVNGVEENKREGNDDSTFDASFRTAISQSYPRRSRAGVEFKPQRIERHHERGRSASPIKKDRSRREEASARREERIKNMQSRPIQTGLTSNDSSQKNSPIIMTPIHRSPTKSAPVSAERRVGAGVKTTLTPFVKSTSTSPHKHNHRGRSQERSPFGKLQASTAANIDSPTIVSSTNSSPLKAIMGPSPAVQRAHARSVSPIKKRSIHASEEEKRI